MVMSGMGVLISACVNSTIQYRIQVD